MGWWALWPREGGRVELGYRGKATYQDVVLDPYQFSAFNPESRVRRYYASLEATSKAPGFQRALAIAYRDEPFQIVLTYGEPI